MIMPAYDRQQLYLGMSKANQGYPQDFPNVSIISDRMSNLILTITMWAKGIKRQPIPYFRISDDFETQSENADSSSGVLLAKEKIEDFEVNQSDLLFSRTPLLKWTALAFLTICNLAMFLSTTRWYYLADYMCMQRSTVWSPIWEDVNTAFISGRFNGTLDAQSEYRGPPNAAVDQAWSSLDDGMAVFASLSRSGHIKLEY
ncbi:hypothetical protein NHQ30_008138 [Ciborinia camelliae]|nr:hypothetical protein NHQ30_008138 [Ciborinia camelliae]